MLVAPTAAEELAGHLADANGKQQSITLCGQSTKNRMAGPLHDSDVTITTRCLNRVLQYDPRDLTISVEAGMPFAELSRILAEHRQMIPLDPPFADQATVGGIVAANASGPRRRLYGTARDMVIGMTFATLEGKLIRTGGMVVKNVAGLDMRQAHDRIVRHAGGYGGGEFQASIRCPRERGLSCSSSTASKAPWPREIRC